jgi:hypothetical protein
VKRLGGEEVKLQHHSLFVISVMFVMDFGCCGGEGLVMFFLVWSFVLARPKGWST